MEPVARPIRRRGENTICVVVHLFLPIGMHHSLFHSQLGHVCRADDGHGVRTPRSAQQGVPERASPTKDTDLGHGRTRTLGLTVAQGRGIGAQTVLGQGGPHQRNLRLPRHVDDQLNVGCPQRARPQTPRPLAGGLLSPILQTSPVCAHIHHTRTHAI
jgi:hypothetical protein